MTGPDFEQARNYALDRLGRELSPDLLYHSIRHTRDDVVPAAERLAASEGLDAEALMLLRTAAYYHDIGFIERYTDNEPIAVRIARSVLPGFGYTPAQVAVIDGIIMATQLPQSPRTLLEALMADADLDVLGRPDFFDLNRALRAELAAYGTTSSDADWNARQLEFLQNHRYFTRSARRLRAAQKQRNIEALLRILANHQDQSGASE